MGGRVTHPAAIAIRFVLMARRAGVGAHFVLVQVRGRKYPQKLAQGGHPVFVGGMKATPIRIVLTDSERQELERRARWLTVPHREVLRAKVVLG